MKINPHLSLSKKSIFRGELFSIVEGIYIEYWGMNTPEYLKNKKRKIEQYKKYDIPLIQIEKDDINDIKGLTIRIKREIEYLKSKYFSR